jgi:hypothetical protein
VENKRETEERTPPFLPKPQKEWATLIACFYAKEFGFRSLMEPRKNSETSAIQCATREYL